MFTKYLANSAEVLEAIPLRKIIKHRSKLFIMFPHNDLDELNKFFKHMLGIDLSTISAKVLISFDSTVSTSEIKKADIVISNQGLVLANRRNMAKHFIVFDDENFTVTYLLPPS